MGASELTQIARRGIARVVEPQVVLDEPGHRARALIEFGHWQEHDPFLGLMEDWFAPGTFGDHPHRGFETVTYVIDGELFHRDNHGGSGILGPGDAQWMTAGRGIIHAEEPHGEQVHTLQLWLNLPAAAKMVEPRYQDLRANEVPVRREPGVEVLVFSGASGGAISPTLNHVPVTLVELRLAAGAAVSQELPEGYEGFVYLLEGEGTFGPEATAGRAGQVLWLEPHEPGERTEVTVAAGEALRALLYAGKPLREPVVAYGPFVMNTHEQIAEAFADFRAGAFGPHTPSRHV